MIVVAARKSRSHPIVRWIFLFAFPVGAILLIWGTVSIIGGQFADNHTTQGTVVSIDRVTAGRGASCSERYTYTVGGTTYHGATSPHCVGKVGGTVTVRYNPQHPSASSLDGLGFSIFLDVCLIGLTILLILATIVIWTYQRTLWSKPRQSDPPVASVPTKSLQ